MKKRFIPISFSLYAFSFKMMYLTNCFFGARKPIFTI